MIILLAVSSYISFVSPHRMAGRKSRRAPRTTTVKRVVVTRQRPRRRTKNVRSRNFLSRPGVALTDSGLRYLECAIAPRDFPGVMSGIPDAYCGKSAVVRQKMLLPIGPPTGTTSSWNTSIMVPAIPNVGAMIIQNHDTATPPNTAAATWSVFDYANAGTIFPNPADSPDFGTSMVQKFRYVSLTAELKQVGPALTAGGTISAARLPGAGHSASHGALGTMFTYLTGFDDIDMVDLQPLPGFYVGHVNAGVYGWSIHQNPANEFDDLFLNSTYAEFGYTESGTPIKGAGASGFFMGFGSQQALAIAITGATLGTSFVLEVEAVIEYQPRAKSLMSSMMADAPPHDPLALDSYQKAVSQLDALVPAAQNAGFWDMFLRVISFGAPIIGAITGPIGRTVGAVIGSAASALRTGLAGGASRQKMQEPPLD